MHDLRSKNYWTVKASNWKTYWPAIKFTSPPRKKEDKHQSEPFNVWREMSNIIQISLAKLRFTSGATPTDLFIASWAPAQLPHMLLSAEVSPTHGVPAMWHICIIRHHNSFFSSCTVSFSNSMKGHITPWREHE